MPVLGLQEGIETCDLWQDWVEGTVFFKGSVEVIKSPDLPALVDLTAINTVLAAVAYIVL